MDVSRGRRAGSNAVCTHYLTAVVGVGSEPPQRDVGSHTREANTGRGDQGGSRVTGDGIAGDVAIAQLRSYLCPGESEVSWSS